MYALKHHPSLTPQRWSTFPTEKQIFMIGNELNRLLSSLAADQDEDTLKLTIECALELTDLTICCQKGNLRFELLRWRDLLASLYLLDKEKLKKLTPEVDLLLKTLLSLNSKSAILL